MKTTRSAGGVVIGPSGDVLVVNQNGDSWSLPKGHIDPGETAQQAAEREIQEESGIKQLTFVKELGSYERYKIGKNGVGEDASEKKIITLFLYATDEDRLAPEDPTNPEARWVKPDEVGSMLSHPKDQQFFENVAPLLRN